MDYKTVGLDKKLNIIRDLLTANHRLKEWGYCLDAESSQEYKDMGLHQHTFTFVSIVKQRALEFKFNVSPNSQLGRFSCYIESNGGRYISLHDFIDVKKLDTNILRLEYYEGDFSQRADTCINKIMQILNDELHDVVIGNAWVDMPFNWHGYK